MKLNAVEKALMNNPVRAVLQRRYEATVPTKNSVATAIIEVSGIGH
jgi:hypothetical protein